MNHLITTRKVAWSSLNCIAYITQDGLAVVLQCLYCDPDDAQWRLTDGHTPRVIVMMHDGHVLKDLCWNPAGNELAVSDVCGRVNFYTIGAASNRCGIARQNLTRPEDSLSAIVGRMWLTSERPVWPQVLEVRGD